MQIWDAFIHNGNREFKDENFEFALGHYEQALKQANAMLHTKHNIHCVTSFIDNTQMQVKVNRILISHCLLANCYFELNWSKKGCEQYEIAYQFLKSAIILSTDN
ncbi:hypothetical protein [Marinicellulosiphila megalodicopiae]|uniref:hypothetical protein n=1 Tax=Marinicellulosiphila megalodicopiae TaxID=2724896 RepID=UPI003BAF3AF2